MCNNYASQSQREPIAEIFDQLGMPLVAAEAAASADVRPTDPAPIVRPVDGGVELVARRWGLAPGRPKAGPVTNYRSEGRRFDGGRCLVPARAFYEFTGSSYPKTKWRFTVADMDWFCIAGLWRPGPTGAAGDERFTMLTTAAGPDVAPYHDRQVVVLDRRAWARWLAAEPVPAGWVEPLPPGTLVVAQVAGATPRLL